VTSDCLAVTQKRPKMPKSYIQKTANVTLTHQKNKNPKNAIIVEVLNEQIRMQL
jgi:hypothetical protein